MLLPRVLHPLTTLPEGNDVVEVVGVPVSRKLRKLHAQSGVDEGKVPVRAVHLHVHLTVSVAPCPPVCHCGVQEGRSVGLSLVEVHIRIKDFQHPCPSTLLFREAWLRQSAASRGRKHKAVECSILGRLAPFHQWLHLVQQRDDARWLTTLGDQPHSVCQDRLPPLRNALPEAHGLAKDRPSCSVPSIVGPVEHPFEIALEGLDFAAAS
mmetsp:Transcript_32834/g.90687  ORF Transcript_32834/g.90687 Transcript_32834/m.90687 type:complete len:209 (+) Transcript_32834:1522-2148(+)